MENRADRRKHTRLPLKLSVLCQKVGVSANQVYSGETVNVSPGGMLIDINHSQLDEGDLLNVEMSVPPTKGLLEYGGRFSSYARIIRVDAHRSSGHTKAASIAQTIALEFCESPKLSV